MCARPVHSEDRWKSRTRWRSGRGVAQRLISVSGQGMGRGGRGADVIRAKVALELGRDGDRWW